MDRIRDIRHFDNGCMNLDDDARVLKKNEHREIWNSIIGVSESAHVSCLQNIKGTSNVFDMAVKTSLDVPTGLRAIGACEDVQENALIFFLCDTAAATNHSILRLYLSDYHCEWILKSVSLLNFQSDYLITSANRIGDLLYWTDGYFNSYMDSDFNPPRKINVEKARKFTEAYEDRWEFQSELSVSPLIGTTQYTNVTAFVGTALYPFGVGDKVVSWALDGINRYKNSTGYGTVLKVYFSSGYYFVITDRPWQDTDAATATKSGYILPYDTDMYFGIDWETMDAIKYKPMFPATVSYDTDTDTPMNRLQNKLFQFCYRWVYDDNEKSVCSPVSDIPIPTRSELITGVYDQTTTDNRIKVSANTGSSEVVRVEILVREGNTGNWQLVKRVYKYDQDGNCLLSGDVWTDFYFYNNELGEPVEQEDINRIFDYVPLVASGQDLIEKNRIVYSNYKESFDAVDVDVSLTSTHTEKEFLFGFTPSFTRFQYPSVPPSGYTGNYIYSNGSQWYQDYGVLQTKFFGGIRIGLGNITLVPFATYIFTISVDGNIYSYAKTDAEQTETWWEYPDTNNNDFVGGTAVVTLDASSTRKDLLNFICQALRNFGRSGNTSAIACTGSADYMNFGNHIWGTWQGQSAGYYVSDDEIFIPVGGGNGNATVNLNKITVSLNVIYNNGTKYRTFKGGETKEFGIEYSDRAGRCSFVNMNEDCRVYVPSQTEGSTLAHQIYQNKINWSISHKPPPEAAYYRWVMRKRTGTPYYVWCPLYGISRSTLSGSSLTFATLSVFKNFTDTKEFFSKFNVGAYEWQSGDRVRFIMKRGITPVGTDGADVFVAFDETLDFEIVSIETPTGDNSNNYYYLYDDKGDPILDPQGNKIKDSAQLKLVIPYFDFESYGITNDDLATSKIIVEIYRPGKTTESNLYYHLTDSLPIVYPHTDQRAHGNTSGTNQTWKSDGTLHTPATGTFDRGDAYLIPRLMQNDIFSAVFPCESMAYSDWFDSDAICIGLPNVENRNARSQQFISNLRYGGLYLENTQVNELSKFLGADYIALPEKFGEINYIKEIGFTLKVIQKFKTSSIYVGRQGLTQADVSRDEVLYASNNTLGTVTAAKSNYGTIHPESCVRHENNLYFYDIHAGVIARDSGNGIRAISQQEDGDAETPYKIKTFIQGKSRTFLSHDVNVFGAYDGRYDMVYFCFVDSTTPSESFTIGFHEPSNRWVSFYSFIPEFIGAMKLSTFSWKNGDLWLHNAGTRMNFYGTQYALSVKTVSNEQPLLKKRFLSITENCNKVLDLRNQGDVYIPEDSTYTRAQTSLVKAGAFRDIEGTWYAPFGKNMTTNSVTPSNDDYLNGDDMRGNYLELTMNSDSTDETNLFTVEVDAIVSNP